jgi:N-methylhydantoinase B
MDHGRYGPQGAAGGEDGGKNRVVITRKAGEYHPPHLSKDEGIEMTEGDVIEVWTPGGGGFGEPFQRAPELVARDVELGYYGVDDAARDYRVAVDPHDFSVDTEKTRALRTARSAS